MNYEEFRTELIRALENQKQPGTVIRKCKVEKNNGVTLEGISIRPEGACVAPAYYPKTLYRVGLTGTDVEDMAADLLRECAHRRFRNVSEEDIRLSIDQVVHTIYYRVVNYDTNRRYFETHPFRRFLDLACTFYFVPDFLREEGGVISVTYDLMNRWDLDIEHLFRIAAANTPRDCPAAFMPLIEAVERAEGLAVRERPAGEKRIFLPEYRDDPSVVLTNKSGRFGASCMLYKHIFEQAAEEAGSDLYVIPSSIHELIIVPADDSFSLDDINGTVRHVNRTALLPEEILSDHVYIYDRYGQVLTA